MHATLIRTAAVTILMMASLAACSAVGTAKTTAAPTPEWSVGADPKLPEPEKSLVPTVRVAPAKGWPAEGKPHAPAGMTVTAFATGLDHPRWIHVLPNGDVLVAETAAPPKPEDGKGIKGMVMKQMMKKAGAGNPSANRITLLRDADSDGVAETRTVFLDKLNSPFGMALVGSEFYVANTDAVMRFAYTSGATRITGPGTKLADLPGGPLNHHWTTVGSNSNIAENGMDKEEGRACIWEIDRQTGAKRLFATGLRNPNGMAWEPRTGSL